MKENSVGELCAVSRVPRSKLLTLEEAAANEAAANLRKTQPPRTIPAGASVAGGPGGCCFTCTDRRPQRRVCIGLIVLFLPKMHRHHSTGPWCKLLLLIGERLMITLRRRALELRPCSEGVWIHRLTRSHTGGLQGRNRELPPTAAEPQEAERQSRSQRSSGKQLRFAEPASTGSDSRSDAYDLPVRSRGCFGCFG